MQGRTPIFRIKISDNNILPKSIEELEKLEFIKTELVVKEGRFYPLEGRINPKKLIKERKKVKIYPDEFGYLYTYQFVCFSLTKALVNQIMIYLGNFNCEIPKDEFIPFDWMNIPSANIKYIQETVLYTYEHYNLRKAPIYNKKMAKIMHDDAKENLKFMIECDKLILKNRNRKIYDNCDDDEIEDSLTYVGGDSNNNDYL